MIMSERTDDGIEKGSYANSWVFTKGLTSEKSMKPTAQVGGGVGIQVLVRAIYIRKRLLARHAQ